MPSTQSTERYFYIIFLFYTLLYLSFVTNCYATTARLFVIAGSEIKSNEGTTPRDPVAMAISALGITPLIMMMVELVSAKCDDIKMVAFADDFSAARKLKSLLQWWTILLEV